MNLTNKVVDDLYEEVSSHMNITLTELKRRIVSGERLIQYYYEWKYNWDPKDESTICF